MKRYSFVVRVGARKITATIVAGSRMRARARLDEQWPNADVEFAGEE